MFKHGIISLSLAALLMGSTGCDTLGNGKRTGEGAGIGALAGAAVGAAWGAARGDWKKGALIGAGAGATVGGVSGMVMDKQAEDMRKAGIKAQQDAAGNMIISMSGDTLKFATGSSVISSDGGAALDKLAGVLKKYPENRINLSGHTDSVGSAEANRALSQQRSDSVRSYLLQQGVPARCLLSSVGYGEEHPIADNGTAEGRALNRRVELSMTVDQDEAKTNEAKREKWSNRNAQQ
jgi:outer membrane protein OmpA-like peptidoglycan-associated protein